MKLFEAFARKAPNKVFLSILLGAMAGISYALLIPLVLSALSVDKQGLRSAVPETVTIAGWEVSNYRFAALFLLTCVFILAARSISQVVLSRVSMEVTSELRIRMYERIAGAPLPALERIGSAKLLAALTTDVPRVVMGARLLPDLLTNSITLVGMLSYLWYLNPDVFAFVMGAIVFGGITYQLPMLLGRRYLAKSRMHIDELQESIRGLIYGAKELKLDSRKRAAYFRDILLASEKSVVEADKTGHTIIRAAMNYGDLLSFFVIGAVCFVFVNYHSISNEQLVGVIMALLYVTGPMSILLNFIPQIAVARVSLNKVNELFRLIPDEIAAADPAPVPEWSTIRFEQAGYEYPSSHGESGFTVGPVDLELHRGEITFIVGGNGSGKSTLSKLITQHYPPSFGEIRFGAEVVTPENLNAFRDGIAAVYSDYYLFDRVLNAEARQEEIDALLRDFAIDHKVRYEAGRFSSLALSDGQKRRLALVVAFVDDKDLYLFDEPAADQDPAFKQIFYRRVLPQLRARNKAVVVITHDDRYFDLADRLIVMNEGRIQRAEDRRATAAPMVHA